MSSVVYREIQVKGALNAVRGMPFGWSLNPFLGCAHACYYCFSRAYHVRYREKNVGTDFDSNVQVRVNIADVLRKELRRGREGSLAVGTATDPYQPIEGKYQLTRRCLEALVDYPMPTSIVTKGPLVVRDIDVLKKLDEKTDLTVYSASPASTKTSCAKPIPAPRHPDNACARFACCVRRASTRLCCACRCYRESATAKNRSTRRRVPQARLAQRLSAIARSRST